MSAPVFAQHDSLGSPSVSAVPSNGFRLYDVPGRPDASLRAHLRSTMCGEGEAGRSMAMGCEHWLGALYTWSGGSAGTLYDANA